MWHSQRVLTCMFYCLSKGNIKSFRRSLGYKAHLLVPAVIVMRHTKEVWRETNGMRLTSRGLLYLNGQCCQQQQWKMDDCTVTSSGNWLIDGLSNWRFLVHSSCMSPISLLSALLINTRSRQLSSTPHIIKNYVCYYVIKNDGSHIFTCSTV